MSEKSKSKKLPSKKPTKLLQVTDRTHPHIPLAFDSCFYASIRESQTKQEVSHESTQSH